jgi:hypothetical protein
MRPLTAARNIVIDFRLLRRTQIVFLLVLELSAASGIHASKARGWSVDLKVHGYQEWRSTTGLWNASEVRLATANNVIAVAIGNPTDVKQTDPRNERAYANWRIALLVFDPASGKLQSKQGPWAGDAFFELYCSSRGNLLLLVRHYRGEIAQIGEELYLLSPAGVELKKRFFAPSSIASKPNWNKFLVSSSGHTLLVGQVLQDGTHYRLLDADTLDTRFEWTDSAGSNSPSVVAISDTELLGVIRSRSQPNTGASNADTKAYVRTFDGPWNPLPVSLDVSLRRLRPGANPNQFALLSNDTIVAINPKPFGKSPILALRANGEAVFTPRIPTLAANTSLSGPISATQDGRYFGAEFAHRPWLSHLMLDVWKMDIAFQDDESLLLVWEFSQPLPVAQVSLGNHVDELFLVHDELLMVALLSGNTLKVIPIDLERQTYENAPR